MFGLVALLFVVTIIHTAAIMNMNEKINLEGESQVLSSAGCLQVTPLYNENQITLNSLAVIPNQFTLGMVFDVKNNCTSGIKLINAGSMNLGTPFYSNLVTLTAQVKNYLNNPENLNVGSNLYSIIASDEETICLDCASGPVQHLSPVATHFDSGLNGYALTSYSIPAGQTKKVMMRVNLGLPDNSQQYVRIKPDRIKWFYDSALTGDYTVTAAEIKTYTFTAAHSNEWVGDYTKLLDQN